MQRLEKSAEINGLRPWLAKIHHHLSDSRRTLLFHLDLLLECQIVQEQTLQMEDHEAV